MYDVVELEKRGIPTVDVATDMFHGEAVFRATGLGMPDLAFAEIPAAISQADLATVNTIADEAMTQIIYGLTRPTESTTELRSGEPRIIEIKNNPGEEDILETWFKYAEERKWTDGFPLTPPTEERVQWMLTGTSRSPDEVICAVPPFFGKGTVEKIAINAVMAGAKPEYLEVIIAAVDALSDPKAHLAGTIATTDPGNAPLLVINGPIVNELGLNSSWSVMGPGWRANSTIGRAVSLCIRNIGGADTPGAYQQHTYYLPADYSMVLAQPYPETPGNWKLLSEQLGYRRDQNIVFAMPSDGPINISPFDSPTQPIPAEGLLKNWVDQMAQQSPRRGFAGFIMFAPEHVRILAAEGWSEEKVKDYIFNTSYNPTYLEAKKEGFTSRGPTVKATTFGLTRKPVSSPPVENGIIKGIDPVGDTFILVAGAPVGGHGAMIPRSSHGGWAVREIGTLAPPPGARPTPLWEGATPTPTPTPEEAPTATPTPEETPSEEEVPTPEETPVEEEWYESVC